MEVEGDRATQLSMADGSINQGGTQNDAVVGVGIEIIGQIGGVPVAASHKIIDHAASGAAAIQVRLNSLPHGVPERRRIGVEGREGTEESPPWNLAVLFGVVIKNRFFRGGAQHVYIKEPGIEHGGRDLNRVEKSCGGVLDGICHEGRILSATFQ
ncbi:MAG: hypothetical protein ACE5R6_11775 [Candidatus Heimdallarchaeota archaeon]